MNVVVGGGVGGLAAALAWRRRGLPVTLYEARSSPGGLASALVANGRRHDGGPYVLLDRPGLEWAFHHLGLVLDEVCEPIRLPEPYRVVRDDAPTVVIRGSLDETCDGLARDFPGAPDRYRAFVAEMSARYARLSPLQRAPFRGPASLLSGGRWRDARFLLRSLGRVLERAGLPGPVRDAVGIWTHVASQPLERAPAPMALVPAVVHDVGAWTVRGGLARIVDALADACERAGVRIVTDAKVDRIVRDGDRVVAVEIGGKRVSVDRVCANAPAIPVLSRLLDPPDPGASALEALPLQSPGVAAYLEVEAEPDVPFLRFRLAGGRCVGLLHPGAVDPEREGLARLFSPVDHAWAERVGAEGQRAHLDALLAEPWWRSGFRAADVVATRIPVEWGRQLHLWRDSMNPVMTAAFMRRGRVPHHPSVARNLALCGSATHPGQWVSFCAISGVLAADAGGLANFR